MAYKTKNGKQPSFREMLKGIKTVVDTPTRKQKKNECFFIVEGQTEENYLMCAQNVERFKYKIKGIKRIGRDNLKETEHAIDSYSLRPRQTIICIFDADVYYNDNNKNRQFHLFWNKYKGRSNVEIFNNMPSVEFWFLLHFLKNTTTMFYSKTVLFKELTKYAPFIGKNEQEMKSDKFWSSAFNTLCGRLYQNLDNAILKAKANSEITTKKRLEKVAKPSLCNGSYTDMYKLFESPNHK
ncbi:MAG: RloB domain-containing protein [Bacteroidales bacterium]|nr:RloB domain-containing protein [Bacteroidales bacterium]